MPRSTTTSATRSPESSSRTIARAYSRCRKPAACRLSAEKALMPTPGGGVMSLAPNPARRPDATGAGGGALGGGETGWGSAVSWMDAHPLRLSRAIRNRAPPFARLIPLLPILPTNLALACSTDPDIAPSTDPDIVRFTDPDRAPFTDPGIAPFTDPDIAPSPDGNEEG